MGGHGQTVLECETGRKILDINHPAAGNSGVIGARVRFDRVEVVGVCGGTESHQDSVNEAHQ